MNAEESQPLSPASSGFALAAIITVLFNTGLAWAKDAYAPLNALMKSLMGHHWTTHATADLVMFFALGLIFWKTGLGEKMCPKGLSYSLIGAVIVGALGLVGWYFIF